MLEVGEVACDDGGLGVAGGAGPERVEGGEVAVGGAGSVGEVVVEVEAGGGVPEVLVDGGFAAGGGARSTVAASLGLSSSVAKWAMSSSYL